MSASVWYWREGSTQHGPITWQKLQSMAAAGKISPSDWVMREGWSDWKLACEANDSEVDLESVGPPPAPPPLPLPPQPLAAAPLAPAGEPMQMVEVPVMDSAALPVALPAPLPLPPLDPSQTLLDPGPPAPSPDGVSRGEVVELRRALRDDGREGPAPRWNVAATVALAASLVGLLFLAFEMGLVGIALGGWCLLVASETGNANGKNLATTAVVIGCVNVIFRVACATVDLGLPL